MNNLQANSLATKKESYFISEPIEFNKKDFKKLNKNSWLKIEQSSLNIVISEDSGFVKGRLFSKDSYIFIKKKSITKKEFRAKKGHFLIRCNLEKELINLTTAIAKEHISGVIIKDRLEFALINLYIKDTIYLEIKEIL